MTKHTFKCAILSSLTALTIVSAAVPADAGTQLHGAVTTTAPNSPEFRYYWTFNKGADHTKGRLQLRKAGPLGVYTAWSIRAGSGNNPGSHHPCIRNHGWLPNGWYNVKTVYENHHGTVEGPAVYLSNKRCHDGTLRTELFIHSSYPWSASHYNSNGCIKVSNTGGGPAHARGHIRQVYNYTKKYHIMQVHVVS